MNWSRTCGVRFSARLLAVHVIYYYLMGYSLIENCACSAILFAVVKGSILIDEYVCGAILPFNCRFDALLCSYACLASHFLHAIATAWSICRVLAVGTDRLVVILKSMRAYLQENGVQFRFGCRVEDMVIVNGKVTSLKYRRVKARGEEGLAEIGGPIEEVRMLSCGIAQTQMLTCACMSTRWCLKVIIRQSLAEIVCVL